MDSTKPYWKLARKINLYPRHTILAPGLINFTARLNFNWAYPIDYMVDLLSPIRGYGVEATKLSSTSPSRITENNLLDAQ